MIGFPKTKKVKKSTLKKKAWEIFSKYIRLRDCLLTTRTKERGKCITCGREYEFKSLQAGHCISGRHNSLLFDEMAVHAQCYYCNIQLGGNLAVYYRVINNMFGAGSYENLELRDKMLVKISPEGYEEIYSRYKQKYEELSNLS